MAVWIILILGLVQGASEFLPISSSGHLVVFYNVFNVHDNTILLSIVLHVATLLSVLFCYWKDVVLLIKNPFCKTNKLLVCATIPTVILALIFKKFVEESFGGGFVIVGFLITAVVLIVTQLITNKQQNHTLCATNGGFVSKSDSITNLQISFKQALVIGVAQGIAVFPGISRSGSTIAMGLISGVKKSDAADFSFLLSIPIILGGLLFELVDVFSGKASLNISWFNLSVGFIDSFLSGLICVKLMIKFVKNKKLTWFSLYLILLSLFLILNRFVLGWF